MKIYDVLKENLTKEKIQQVLTPEIRNLGNIFSKNGFELRIVGGAVRDLLLGKTPKDIDFATDAMPDEMIEFLENAGWHTIPTGIQHGTISVPGELNEPYEITTLRIDVVTDGRHAEVEFTRDFKKDAERRDLTFNAMSIDMNGRVYDYFNGKNDLRNNIARFVGDPNKRIQEDYLRILRYFRFQGRMKNAIFDNTKNAIKRNAPGLAGISGERIWAEIQKILIGNHVEQLLQVMCELNVSTHITLPCNNVSGIDQVVSRVQSPIAVLSYITKTEEEMESIISHWKLSNIEKDLYRFLLKNKLKDLNETDVKIALSNGVNKNHLIELLLLQDKEEIANLAANWQIPVFPITGSDLIGLGFKPGPKFGQILEYLKDKWQESGFELTRDQLIKLIGDKE